MDQEDVRRVQEPENQANALVIRLPTEREKLGAFSIVCLILNRTVGSGIFVVPAIVLKGTGNVGVSLLLWVVGAIVATCGVLVWLEMGLSVPRFDVHGSEVSVPRSGGEKNYIEYIYRRPLFLATCVYGMLFIIFGNLAGNAIAFGSYIMLAAGHPAGHPADYSAIRGLAVGILTVACVFHAVWRKGGIWLNNAFGVLKLLILLLIIVVGLAALGGASFGHGPSRTDNLSAHRSFDGHLKDVQSVANSFLYVLYPFSGYEQPFYVLSEVSRPQQIFARSVVGTMILVGALYLLVNIVYMGVVPKDVQINSRLNIATEFFQRIFGTEAATRILAGIIALSISGNLIAMAFTAGRVKQEIAKEGILPFSRFFAKSKTTLAARVWTKVRSRPNEPEDELEQSPAAALLLHWMFSVLLVGVTAFQTPVVAYTMLVSIYSYIFVVLVGLLVAGGLVYKRLYDRKAWLEKTSFRPWGGPTAAIIYFVVCLFLAITAFLRPSKDSPFSFQQQQLWWYVPPTVSLAALLLGVFYWVGLQYVISRVKGKSLTVERMPVIVSDDHGGWVQHREVVRFSWSIRTPPEQDVALK